MEQWGVVEPLISALVACVQVEHGQQQLGAGETAPVMARINGFALLVGCYGVGSSRRRAAFAALVNALLVS